VVAYKIVAERLWREKSKNLEEADRLTMKTNIGSDETTLIEVDLTDEVVVAGNRKERAVELPDYYHEDPRRID
jgi:hypothetical protein